MNAQHVLQARTRRGATLEIGTLGNLEKAVRLQHALEDGLGDRFAGFSIVEREPEPPTVRSLTRDELRSLGAIAYRFRARHPVA